MFYTLSHAGYEFVKTKIQKLNRIAKKINQPEIQFELIKKQLETDPKTMVSQTMYYIMCIGEAPVLKDWKFMCTLDFTPKGNLFNMTYDAKAKGAIQIPEKFRKTPFTLCEDCHVKRFRTKVFVLFNEKKDKWMQVGSTCLGAFLGVNESEVHQLAEFATTLATMPNAMGKWASKTANSKKNNDYIGYKKEDLFSLMFLTVNRLWNDTPSYYNLTSYSFRGVRFSNEYNSVPTYIKGVTDKERTQVTEMLKWFETWKPSFIGNFTKNMLVVLKNEVISKRHYKFINEAFKIYIKYSGKPLYTMPVRKAICVATPPVKPVEKIKYINETSVPQTSGVTQVKNTPSNYIGTIGSLNDFNLDTIVTHASRAKRGSFLVLKDANGNELSWICPYFYRVDTKIRVNKAFVMKHQEYKGSKQTIIGNVSFTKI